MDIHSLNVLEYFKILEILKGYANTSIAKNIISSLLPINEPEIVKLKLVETKEARIFLQNEGGLPFSSLYEIEEIIKKAKVRSLLNGIELNKIKNNLFIFNEIKETIENKKDRYPNLFSYALNIKKDSTINLEIERCIDEEGNVKDDASPELKSIRRKLRDLREKIIEKLEDLFTLSIYKNMIAEPIVTLRNGRYVVPIKKEYSSYFPSIVQDTSSSGRTLFVEPQFIVSKNNELIELRGKEEEEVKKILTNLTIMVWENFDNIKNSLEITGELDFIFTKAKLAEDWNAVEPEIVEKRFINIVDGKHPLLKGEVVPISIYIGEKFKMLIITGPNTGGKTVTLKTIGLFSSLAQSGLFVPANVFETYIFDNILADIGEEQSIEQSLSTFSSHMKQIVNILNNATENSLILLDELGAGTDPEEGACLAQSIAEYIYNLGAICAIATHYPKLKEFAYKTDGVENCSVGFDSETLKPTYKLYIGVPGESRALTIAAHLNLKEEIINNARNLLGEEHKEKEFIISKMRSDQTIIEQDKNRIEEEKNLIVKEREQLEALLNELESKRKEYILLTKRKMQELIEETKNKMDEILKNLPKERKEIVEKKKELEEEIVKIGEELIEEEVEKNFVPFDEIEVGDLVYIDKFGKQGIVLKKEEEDRKIQVQIGTMRVILPYTEITRKINETFEIGEEGQVILPEKDMPPMKIELHGKSVDEAIAKLDKYIDSAALVSYPFIYIYHGVGSGILKKAIHEFLRNHPHVERFSLDPENVGVTIVFLK
ncbi:MAG TPA: endonuclease MutS2 [Caldisericia bacterium]|nr:endonuclease MutS2 [Caldisericia bacterium]